MRGLGIDGVRKVCNLLAKRQAGGSQPWGALCQSGSNGPLRVVAPFPYQVVGNGAFANYFTKHVNNVWNHYTNNDLIIDTQTGSGRVACRVRNGALQCNGDNRSYNKPTAGDIFGCNSGPFAIIGSDNGIHRAVVPRLCAAFNRGTLLSPGGNLQPGPAASTYYTTTPANYYSAYVHQNQPDGRGYAFSKSFSVYPRSGRPLIIAQATTMSIHLEVLIRAALLLRETHNFSACLSVELRGLFAIHALLDVHIWRRTFSMLLCGISGILCESCRGDLEWLLFSA